MINADQALELLTEFPDLEGTDVVLAKEVYAHFGLLFFKFSLVEHSLINILTFHHVGTELQAKRIRSKEEWEGSFDQGYDAARKKTFGNLIRAISVIDEFSVLHQSLGDIKRHRDYFAHHFFREEVGMYRTEEGCWHVLWAIKELRDRLVALDKELEVATDAMRRRLKLPQPPDDHLKDTEEKMIAETQTRIDSGRPFDWAKPG